VGLFTLVSHKSFPVIVVLALAPTALSRPFLFSSISHNLQFMVQKNSEYNLLSSITSFKLGAKINNSFVSCSRPRRNGQRQMAPSDRGWSRLKTKQIRKYKRNATQGSQPTLNPDFPTLADLQTFLPGVTVQVWTLG
jgi:hypothetical protein